MKLKPYFLVFVLIMALGGCAPKGKITGQDYVDASAFITSYMHAFNSRDIDKLMEHYSGSSLTYVHADSEKYYLTKADLSKAFKMKVEGWDKTKLRLEDFKVLKTASNGGLTEIDVEFKVNSTTWLGEYRTKFALESVVGGFKIFKENL